MPSLLRRLGAHVLRLGAAAVLLAAPLAPAAGAAEITVMSSGGFTAALQQLAPAFAAQSGDVVHIVLGPSMGTASDAIPVRLARGEGADLLIMVGYALGDLVTKGVVVADSRVDLADSSIAMCVRAGAAKPDISTVDAFKAALLAAPSIAYSDSASGVYIEKEMYTKLGLATELAPKSRMIVSERVGNVVARGDAAVGFQQVSELLPVKGIEILGKIPAAVQRVTTFSAGIPANAKEPAAAKALLAFLASPASIAVVKQTGLDPIPHP